MKRLNQLIGQKGVAAVEFAIVLPFLVLLVFGTIEFGLMFYNKQVITNASREGARAGITGILTFPDIRKCNRLYWTIATTSSSTSMVPMLYRQEMSW